ncbi:hypothetical protein LN042_19700 [Kitasatospora sp. RB6PN24]|uniref:hypothetical protein n=1 Tax=Kitasatospora humi TaxID=2893891 RepID=UPI001E322170|nr:hypothetical protein [Kitasatospora humi]MCC9309283.1 hypothetical protein [Kitasatospora humi]
MKIRYVELDGTPEELDQSKLAQELLRLAAITHHSQSEPVPAGNDSTTDTWSWTLGNPIPGVAEEGQSATTALLSRNEAAGYFVRFLSEATGWENAAVFGVKRKSAQAGDPLDYSDYLRLRKVGSHLGGFAYVYADTGRVNLRLNYDNSPAALQALAPAAFVVHTGHRAYRVSIDIADEDTLQQAVQLAKIAYDLT